MFETHLREFASKAVKSLVSFAGKDSYLIAHGCSRAVSMNTFYHPGVLCPVGMLSASRRRKYRGELTRVWSRECDVTCYCQIIYVYYNVKEAHIQLLIYTVESLIFAVKSASL